MLRRIELLTGVRPGASFVAAAAGRARARAGFGGPEVGGSAGRGGGIGCGRAGAVCLGERWTLGPGVVDEHPWHVVATAPSR